MKRDAITLSLVSRSNSPPKSEIYNTVQEGKARYSGNLFFFSEQVIFKLKRKLVNRAKLFDV